MSTSYLTRELYLQGGDTALLKAAHGGHASDVALLLDAKADPNHANNVRFTYISVLVIFAFCSCRGILDNIELTICFESHNVIAALTDVYATGCIIIT